ncbi:MAG: penicillin-binding protein 2 [Kiritimatiellae bacterium]|nr:penicillin-binding protein 2 [Kiritimatiellia bacterium]
MSVKGENWRFLLPVFALSLATVYLTVKLIRAHVAPQVDAPDYIFTKQLLARRGSIYSSYGKNYPFAKSVPYWEYSLDPVALTNSVVRRKGEPPRPKAAIVKTIAEALGLDFRRVMKMADSPPRHGYRSQFLALSSDPDAHRVLADSHLVAGVAIHDRQVRQYLHGRRLAHVLGSVNAEHCGSAGIEQLFNRELTGSPGTIKGMLDARGRELYDKRKVSIKPIPGSDIHLTIDHNIQFEVEDKLKWGLREFGAASGWCIVMDSRTGAVLAMASLPDYEPLNFGRASDAAKINRAIAFNYEPGSVMKVITAAAAIDAGFAGPGTVYRTNRDDPRYYRLPGDGSHVWEPTMTVKDAIVHSSNIVIGKLSFDFGAKRLFSYMKKFGFGAKTGIDLPGEQFGILPDPDKRMWDKASRSRAGIGQFVAVTAIQMAGAYQAIANDGVRMKPYIVSRIVDSGGAEVYRHTPEPAGRPVSAKTARTMRRIMTEVATRRGTARRAAIRGYSVAGKTGTAQKQIPGGRGYYAGLYRASFCGIVPAGEPRLVVFVTLDFEANTKFHQGGNSAGPVFKRITEKVLRYLMIQPDRPEEMLENPEDEESDL